MIMVIVIVIVIVMTIVVVIVITTMTIVAINIMLGQSIRGLQLAGPHVVLDDRPREQALLLGRRAPLHLAEHLGCGFAVGFIEGEGGAAAVAGRRVWAWGPRRRRRGPAADLEREREREKYIIQT